MTKVILDTNYWICFRDERRELFHEFEDLVDEQSIEVLFSYGNFIDLIKRNEQDELAEMIPSVVSTYIPAQDYQGHDYTYSSDPIELIPDQLIKQEARHRTMGLDEVETLKHLFSISDWEGLEGYKEAMEYLQGVHQECGKNYVTALLFDESDDFTLLDRGRSEVISNMIKVNRISFIAPDENLKYSDIADMEICTHALMTNCDILLIESKWKNIQLLESTMDDLESDVEMLILDDIDEFVEELRENEDE